jgi:hypothetical protein
VSLFLYQLSRIDVGLGFGGTVRQQMQQGNRSKDFSIQQAVELLNELLMLKVFVGMLGRVIFSEKNLD